MSQADFGRQPNQDHDDPEVAARRQRLRQQTNRDLRRIRAAGASETRNARREGTVVGGIIAATVAASQFLPFLG